MTRTPVFCLCFLLVVPAIHGSPRPQDQKSEPQVQIANAGAHAGSAPRSKSVAGSVITPDLFFGAASSVVALSLPPGRDGLTPNLSLAYRSSNPHSWLGIGWAR